MMVDDEDYGAPNTHLHGDRDGGRMVAAEAVASGHDDAKTVFDERTFLAVRFFV